jgi:hypothetical protein
MALFSDTAPRVASPVLTLQAGQVYVPPQGWYYYTGSLNSDIQRYDAISQTWRSTGRDPNHQELFFFDGITTRIANPTGCVVGAVVTNAGTGYTSPPTVTATGGAVFTAIVGGALSTAATVLAAGNNYQYPPILWIEQPPQPGTQAAGTITLTSGTISSITLNDQGSGYILPPNALVLNDWRDTVGSGGAVALSITGAQTVTALVVTNHGNPITSGTVPTIVFAGGGGSGAAATAIMDWTVQSVSVTTAGAGYTSAAGALTASAAGGYVTTTPTYLGGATSIGAMRYWPAIIDMATNSSGGIASLASIIDAGRYQAIPTPTIMAAQPPSTTGALSFIMGGRNATVYLVPAQQ